MKSIDLSGRIRTVIEMLRAEDPSDRAILIGDLRLELERIKPRFADVESMDEFVCMAARQIARYPGASLAERSEALRREESCIHALQEDLDYHDTAASIGPVVTLTE